MNNTSTKPALGLSRLPAVQALTGLGRSSIYGRMNRRSKTFDPYFPHPIALSPSGRGAVGWVTAEIIEWVEHRLNASRRQIKNW